MKRADTDIKNEKREERKEVWEEDVVKAFRLMFVVFIGIGLLTETAYRIIQFLK